jgi:hypothetical protein
MSQNPRLSTRLLAILLFPVTIAVMIPLALVFVCLFYLNALLRAPVEIVKLLVRRKEVAPSPQSHFLDMPTTMTRQ